MQDTITKFISFNYCNGETHHFCTEQTIQGYPDAEQLKFYKSFLNEEQLKALDTEGIECLSVYDIDAGSRPWAIEDFLKEAFGNLLKDLVKSFGEDECMDFLPAAIDEFFSVLQAFQKSDNPDIQEGLKRCDFNLWANLYDTYMQSFDFRNEHSRNYIDTDILTWDQGMTETPRFPAILL